MATAKPKARPKKRTARTKAYARRPQKVSASPKKTGKKAKVNAVAYLFNDLTPYALDILDEIEARRETLTSMVAKNHISSETAEQRRHVLTYLARRINAKGCRNKLDLQKMVFTFGDRAEKLHAATKATPIPAGTLARRRWIKARDENRDKAIEAMQYSVYARELYGQLTCETLPCRPAVRRARAAAAAAEALAA